MRAGQGGIGDDVLLVSFHDMAVEAGEGVAGGWVGSVWAWEGGVEGRGQV